MTQYPALEAMKLAGPFGSYAGSYLGAGIPGMLGYYAGSDKATPDENMGFWRPTLYGAGGTIGGGVLGGLAAMGIAHASGLSPVDGEPFVPLGAGIGALAGGTTGTYLAAKHQAELPRPAVA